MNILKYLIFFVSSTLLLSNNTFAADFNYRLEAKKIADNTYVFIGKIEDFSFENGGNIVNTGFIITSAGVVVIDTGSSLRYGQQMKEAIASVTKKPITRVYITHHHPDHFLGSQAFAGNNIYALESTLKNIKNEGAGFTDNLYLMVGDWMRGTDVLLPSKIVKPGVILVGEHELELLSFSGHTNGDLAIYDRTTGVLFSGDLIFHKRTLTTPHANIKHWLTTLTALKKINYKTLVPGHGPISHDKNPINEMVSYLNWLDSTLYEAANNGLSMMDAMQIPLPKRFTSNALLKNEFSRSITHLYASYEDRVFKRVN